MSVRAIRCVSSSEVLQPDRWTDGWVDGRMDGFFMSKPRSKMPRWIPTFLVAGVMFS